MLTAICFSGVAGCAGLAVGNMLIDTFLRYRSKAQESTILQDLQLVSGAEAKPYAILTLHRPANIDDSLVFSQMFDAFLEIFKRMPIIFRLIRVR